MPTWLTLALCGGTGALMYAFPIMIAALKLVPPDKFAPVTMGFSIFVGAIMAPLLIPLIASHWPALTQPEPYPLAIGIGLAINPLAPIVIKKLTSWADAYQIGKQIMTLLITTFLAGLLYALSGGMGLVRHFLLEPRVNRIPATPKWLMNVFFGFSTICLYVGLRFLTAWFTGNDIAASAPATNIRMLMAGAIFVYMAALLYDTITRQERLSLDDLFKKLQEIE